MHMRKRRVDRYSVSLEWMKSPGFAPISIWVVWYIDEFLDCSSVVEHRVKLGSQSLGAGLQRCRESGGEVNGRSFLQLLQSLAESVFMYGAEVWGCHHKLEGLSRIQLRAMRIIFGVGLHHPKGSLLMEADAVPIA